MFLSVSQLFCMHVCMCICIYVCMYAYKIIINSLFIKQSWTENIHKWGIYMLWYMLYIYICYICYTYICMYVFMHECMIVCMHVYIFACSLPLIETKVICLEYVHKKLITIQYHNSHTGAVHVTSIKRHCAINTCFFYIIWKICTLID